MGISLSTQIINFEAKIWANDILDFTGSPSQCVRFMKRVMNAYKNHTNQKHAVQITKGLKSVES